VAERGAPEGRLVPATVSMYVLTVPPDSVIEELKRWRETLLTRRVEEEEELAKLVETAERVAGILDGFSNRLVQPFTTHSTMAVPPHSLAEAYRNYSITILLLLRQILEELEVAIRETEPAPENAERLAKQVDAFLTITRVVLTTQPKVFQVLLNALARNLPDLAQRAATTFEPSGRMLIRSR